MAGSAVTMDKPTMPPFGTRPSIFARLQHWLRKIRGLPDAAHPNFDPQPRLPGSPLRSAAVPDVQPAILSSAVPGPQALVEPVATPTVENRTTGLPGAPGPTIPLHADSALNIPTVAGGGTVYLDTETTGLFGDVRIVEIAIVDDDGNPLVNTLVNPGIPIPAEATAIHHISDSDVAGAPTLEQLMPQIRTAIRGRKVVIYNAAYDQKLFPDRLADALFVECAMRRFKQLPVGFGNGNGTLERAAAWAGHIWIGPAHRALADARAALTVWKKLETECVPTLSPKSSTKAPARTRSQSKSPRQVRPAPAPAKDSVSELSNDPSPPKTGTHRASTLAELELATGGASTFAGKTVVFTGELTDMKRPAATELVESLGGLVRTSVTRKTDYLVVGRFTSDKDTRKKTEAENLIAEGREIRILLGPEFSAIAGVIGLRSPETSPEDENYRPGPAK